MIKKTNDNKKKKRSMTNKKNKASQYYKIYIL